MVVLLLRRTKEYFYDNKISLQHVVGDKENAVKHIESWPFEMPYMEFRKRLREISWFSIKENRFDAIINWSNPQLIGSLPPGTWVIPMDEDDWISSGIADRLRRIDSGNSISWNTVRTNPEGKILHHDFHESCAYAIRMPLKGKFDWLTFVNHMKINNCDLSFQEEMAVRNETIASLGFLMRTKESVCDTLKKSVSFQNSIPAAFWDQHKAYRDLLLKQRIKK